MEVLVGIATVAVTLVGLYLANSIRRQTRAQIAERRLDAYSDLMALMKVATPTRWDVGQGSLSEQERHDLHASLTEWYYAKGAGLLVEAETRRIFIHVKRNLVRPHGQVIPDVAAKGIEKAGDAEAQDQAHGKVSMSQLSLLRSSMRADLSIYTTPGSAPITEELKQFLLELGINPNDRPWAKPRYRGLLRRAQRLFNEPVAVSGKSGLRYDS